MKIVDITECMMNAVENIIFKEWRHEGYICDMKSEEILVIIDGIEYVIQIKEKY